MRQRRHLNGTSNLGNQSQQSKVYTHDVRKNRDSHRMNRKAILQSHASSPNLSIPHTPSLRSLEPLPCNSNPGSLRNPDVVPITVSRRKGHIRQKSPSKYESLKTNASLSELGKLLSDRYDGKRSIRSAFRVWDRDKDGKLSCNDVKDMIACLGIAPLLGHEKQEDIFAYIETLPGQSLQYNDFCTFIQPLSKEVTYSVQVAVPHKIVSCRFAHKSKQAREILRDKLSKRDVRRIFRGWDSDKSGVLDYDEVERNLKNHGIEMPKSELAEFMKKLDENRDGRISYHEFLQLLRDEPEIPTLRSRRVGKEGISDAHGLLRNALVQKYLDGGDVMLNKSYSNKCDYQRTFMDPREFKARSLSGTGVKSLFENRNPQSQSDISGQEDKQQKALRYANRLQSLQRQQSIYEARIASRVLI